MVKRDGRIKTMERDVQQRMIGLCQSLVRMLDLMFRRFPHLTPVSIGEGEEMKKEFERESSELTRLLLEASKTRQDGREWVKPFLGLLSHFDRMAYNVDGVLDRLKKMVYEGILFSDRGVREVSHVAGETIDLMQNLPDLITTRNRLLAQQIQEKGKNLFKAIDTYAEEHEERLIEGVCMPKSAPIYLGLLESFKAMAFHILEISEKLVGPGNRLEK